MSAIIPLQGIASIYNLIGLLWVKKMIITLFHLEQSDKIIYQLLIIPRYKCLLEFIFARFSAAQSLLWNNRVFSPLAGVRDVQRHQVTAQPARSDAR